MKVFNKQPSINLSTAIEQEKTEAYLQGIEEGEKRAEKAHTETTY